MGKLIVSLFVLTPLLSYAETTENSDQRYCGTEPRRNAAGKILRSVAERKRFEALYPLPAEYNRADWQVDHVIPLVNLGCDTIINMQWLPKKIKTCADDNCKDRWERVIYKQ